MCGICGVISDNMTHTEMEGFKELLVLNQFRGMDGTGVFGISEKKKGSAAVTFVKEEFDATYFLTMPTKKKGKLLDHTNKLAMVGHCRAATVGHNSVENSHPFSFENVIGIHNGTLSGTYPYEKDYDTDSEALYRAINDHGIDEAIIQLDPLSAYSLVWYDKKEHTINFLRNDRRPLWFAYSSSKHALAFSSEKRALQFIDHTEGRTMILNNEMWQMKPGLLVTIDLDTSIEQGTTTREVETKKWQAIGYKGYPGYTEYGGYTGGYDDGQYYDDQDWEEWNKRAAKEHQSKAAAIEIHESSALTREYKPVYDPNRLYIGMRGTKITSDTWLDIISEGCCLCGGVPEINDIDLEYKIGWITSDRFSCDRCMEKEDGWAQRKLVEWQAVKETEATTFHDPATTH